MNCPIDAAQMAPLFTHELLGRHQVQYHRCPSCGLIATEEPYWLEEAYQNFYTEQDTGALARNNLNALKLPAILALLGLTKGTLIDCGGGYGILVRLLRDKGIQAFRQDKYCPNIFAREYEAEPNLPADILFMSEVLEHLTDPVTELTRALNDHNCHTLLLTTTIHYAPPSLDWPYWGFPHGQHIQFHTQASLNALACRLGLHHIPLYSDFHLLTDKPPSATVKWLMQQRLLMIAFTLCRSVIF